MPLSPNVEHAREEGNPCRAREGDAAEARGHVDEWSGNALRSAKYICHSALLRYVEDVAESIPT